MLLIKAYKDLSMFCPSRAIQIATITGKTMILVSAIGEYSEKTYSGLSWCLKLQNMWGKRLVATNFACLWFAVFLSFFTEDSCLLQQEITLIRVVRRDYDNNAAGHTIKTMLLPRLRSWEIILCEFVITSITFHIKFYHLINCWYEISFGHF